MYLSKHSTIYLSIDAYYHAGFNCCHCLVATVCSWLGWRSETASTTGQRSRSEFEPVPLSLGGLLRR